MLHRLLIVTLLIAALAACATSIATPPVTEAPPAQAERPIPEPPMLQPPTTESPTSPPPTSTFTAAISDLKVTILYDNTTTNSQLKSDWGFAALVEYGSHNLLFDTGANGQILLGNMQQLGVDPRSIEAVIFSHDHSDHTSGLQALLETGVRPTVYIPSSFGQSFKNRVRSETTLVQVNDPVEVVPGVHITRPTGSIAEEALVVETRDGTVVLTGCAHPGVKEIVRQAQAVVSGKVAYLIGGFHLYQTAKDKLPPIITGVHQLGVEKILPAHCTGDNAQALFQTEYGENYVEGGVGRTIAIAAK